MVQGLGLFEFGFEGIGFGDWVFDVFWRGFMDRGGAISGCLSSCRSKVVNGRGVKPQSGRWNCMKYGVDFELKFEDGEVMMLRFVGM